MPSTVEQTNRRRERFRSRGLCQLCGKEPRFQNYKIGRNCLRNNNNHKRTVRRAAEQEGLCQNCGIKPAAEGRLSCSDCLNNARGRAAAQPETKCRMCGKPTGGKRAQWCKDCRPAPNEGRRKYKADERIAKKIREAYALGSAARKPGAKGKAYVTLLAEELGWPYWAVQKEAQRLGVARIKEDNWSPEELEILQRNAHWTPSTIQKRLKEAGFTRSTNAIEIKRSRLNLFQSHEFISPYNLAKYCFGVNHEVVTRWIKKGWLRSMERKDMERNDTCHWIRQEWVYEFVVKHPLAFDIRKVDQLWLIDLLTKGNVGLTLREINEERNQPSITEMERNEFGHEERL